MSIPMRGAAASAIAAYVTPAVFDKVRKGEGDFIDLEHPDSIAAAAEVARAIEGALDAVTFAMEYLVADDNHMAQSVRDKVCRALLAFLVASELYD